MTQPIEHGTSAPKPDLPENRTGVEHTAKTIAQTIAAAIGEPNFNHWLSNRSRFELTKSVLQIFVPNPFIANWLLKRFRTQFNAAAATLLGPSGAFELEVDESLQNKTENAQAVATLPAVVVPSAERSPDTQISTGRPTTAINGIQKLDVRPANRRRFNSFNTIIAGECNQLAVMAAKQVARIPRRTV